MEYNFLITLRKPDFKIIDIISQLLYLVAFSAFVFFSSKLQSLLNVYSVSALLLLIIYIVLRIKQKRQGNIIYYTAGLAVASITFMAGPYTNWWLCIFYFASLLFERELKFHKEVGVSEKDVVFNTLIKNRYDWSEFTNLLIKDGIITFDFKSNKVLQKEIEGEVSPEIEAEFNEFCRERITAAGEKPQLNKV